MDISEIRQRNAKYLAQKIGGINAFSEKLGKSQPQISHIIGERPTKNIGNKIAREIEQAFNLEKDWLDHVHDELWEKPNVIPLQSKPEKSPPKFTDEEIKFMELLRKLSPEHKNLIEQTTKTLVATNQKPEQKVA